MSWNEFSLEISDFSFFLGVRLVLILFFFFCIFFHLSMTYIPMTSLSPLHEQDAKWPIQKRVFICKHPYNKLFLLGQLTHQSRRHLYVFSGHQHLCNSNVWDIWSSLHKSIAWNVELYYLDYSPTDYFSFVEILECFAWLLKSVFSCNSMAKVEDTCFCQSN